MNNIDLMNFWLEASNNDYETMKLLFEGGKYTWSLFIGHLVIEKLLKALYAKNNKSEPYAPKIHDLLYLVEKIGLNITENQENDLSEITRFNIDGRYDDYKNSFYNLCTKEYTENSINKISNIRNWILGIINTKENEKEGDGKNE